MMKPLSKFLEKLRIQLAWLPALVTRLSVGWVFLESGYGKLMHLDKVREFFESLGIPAASIQAPFVAGVELLGGILLIVGAWTRIASLPLIGVMVVAIKTAKSAELEGFSDLFGLSEYLYVLLLIWLAIHGAGALSVDGLFSRKKKA
jgi:putative oxidoreductase